MIFKRRRPNVYLYFCALSVNLTSFVVGCCFAWTSPAIPRLNGSIEPNDNPLGPEATLTAAQECWIASLLPLGAAVSSLLSGHLADKRGRKEVLVVSTIVTIIGFGVMHFAQQVAYICLARFICGLSVGTTFTVIPMYVGETAEDSNRGTLGMFMVLFLMLGVLFTYGVGSLITLNELNITNLAAPVLFMIIFDWFMPESPYWLMAQDRFKDAEKALRRLRKYTEDELVSELAQIRQNVDESFESRGGLRDLFCQKELLKGICITCGLVMFQQLSGINVILFYMQSIFEETRSTLPADLSSILIGAVQVLACLISSFFVENLGRKILLLFSGIGTCLSLIFLGVYCYQKDVGENVEDIYWLPVVSIVCFIMAYAVGFGPIPFVVLSEVFPPQIKSAASTITICVCLLLTFCTTTFFPLIKTHIGMAPSFWILSLFCFIGTLFVFTFVPETKGKSLLEIQEILKK